MKISLTSFLCFSFIFRPFFYFRNIRIYVIKRKLHVGLKIWSSSSRGKKKFPLSLRSVVKYFFHSKINFISSRHRVISSHCVLFSGRKNNESSHQKHTHGAKHSALLKSPFRMYLYPSSLPPLSHACACMCISRTNWQGPNLLRVYGTTCKFCLPIFHCAPHCHIPLPQSLSV